MMTIETSRVGRTTLIKINGRVDSMNASRLKAMIAHEVNRPEQQIVLNMEGVTHMSAAGLRVLRYLHEAQGSVRIANPSYRVREILQITGLDMVYKVYDSQMEAVHTIRAITNAYTNLELSWLASLCPPATGTDFLTWLQETTHRRWDSLDNQWETTFEHAAETGLKHLIDAGVTMVVDVTATGKSIAPLLKSGLRAMIYVELIGHDPHKVNERFERTRSIIEQWRPHENKNLKIGLAIHAPYSVHPDLMNRGLDYARANDLPLCIQVARCAEETEWMQSGSGAIKSIFIPPIPFPGKSSIAYLDDIGALRLKPLLIHAVHVDDEDIQRIKAGGCTVVHLPRADLRLRCGRMPLEKFLAAGIPVLMGTGSLAAVPSLNIFDELEVATALHHGHVKPDALIELVHGTLPMFDQKTR